jgi:acyl-CoA thioesterase
VNGKQRVEAMLAADVASTALGIEVRSHGDGRAEATMTVRPHMTNGYDIAHEGMLFSLADTAFACACNSSGRATVASGAQIVFVAPARAGDRPIARAEVRTSFGRSGIYDVEVSREDGTVIAEFRGHSHELGSSRP